MGVFLWPERLPAECDSQAMRVPGCGDLGVVTGSEGSGAGGFQAFVFFQEAGQEPQGLRRTAVLMTVAFIASEWGLAGRRGWQRKRSAHACVDGTSTCQNCYHGCFLRGCVKYDVCRKVYKTSLFGLMNDSKTHTHLTASRSRQASPVP